MSTSHDNEDIRYEPEEGDSDFQTKEQKIKDLRGKVKEAEKKASEHLDGWQRARAEYVNLERELESIRAKTKERTISEAVLSMTTAIDSFDMAMRDQEAWNNVSESWRQGVEYIYSQLIKGIEEMGVVVINETDIPFDPTIHEPLEDSSQEGEESMVVEVRKKGFKINNHIIRPAVVVLAAHK